MVPVDLARVDTASPDEMRAALGKLAKAAKDHEEYARAETVFTALAPIMYGILTFVFTDVLWRPDGVHAAALQVPGAPQSWGGVFIVLGIGMIVFSLARMRRTLFAFAITGALIFATFMVFVLMAEVAYPRTLGQAAFYCAFSLLFLNRARLAWVS